MKCTNPKIEWQKKKNVDCLRFTFEEELTEQNAVIAIKEWREAFQSKANNSVVLIWDCRKMKGYETGARMKWTDALKKMKPQIAKIWLITNSNIIKMGAAVMGMVTSLDIKTIPTEDGIII